MFIVTQCINVDVFSARDLLLEDNKNFEVRVPSGLAEKKALRNRPKIRKLTARFILI